MPLLTSADRLGTVIDGKYRLDRVLGEGGMGVVYDGMHLRLGRRVAVKFLHAQFSQSTDVVDRFLREAQATSRLQHPNVVAVHDIDVSADGCVFMVLEFLEGRSFAQFLEDKRTIDKEEMLAIIGPVCDALATAHAAGIVHRDIKPDNVYLSLAPGGRIVPKVLDFGIAKLTDGAAGSATQTGSVMGTPLYMSPEQAMGKTKDIGPRSDLWSTAVMTYEALAGRPPFDIPSDATATTVVLAVVMGDIKPLRDVKPQLGALSDVLGKALDRDPAGRHESVAAFAEALRRACDPPNPEVTATRPGHADPQAVMAATMMAAAPRVSAVTATPFATPSMAPPDRPASRSSRGWVMAVGIALVLVVALSGAAFMLGGSGAGTPTAAASGIAATGSSAAVVPPTTIVAAELPPPSAAPTVTPTLTPTATDVPPPSEAEVPPSSVAVAPDAHRDPHRRDHAVTTVPATTSATTTTTTAAAAAGVRTQASATGAPTPPAGAVHDPDPAPTHRAGSVSVDDF